MNLKTITGLMKTEQYYEHYPFMRKRRKKRDNILGWNYYYFFFPKSIMSLSW